MDVCKCIVPLQHRCTLNSCRAASPLVRLVEGKERWKASDPSQDWDGIKPISTVTCMMLKATANDRHTTTQSLATINFMGLDLILLSVRWHK
ncbi:hypothetical protein TNCV_956321 [Trichonephila clavipes]|nr:hypothetical protein TNCV_956321 [Trichonephila clavipes]